jgi:hypothetical protein
MQGWATVTVTVTVKVLSTDRHRHGTTEQIEKREDVMLASAASGRRLMYVTHQSESGARMNLKGGLSDTENRMMIIINLPRCPRARACASESGYL